MYGLESMIRKAYEEHDEELRKDPTSLQSILERVAEEDRLQRESA